MPTNPFFNNYRNKQEQNLVEDLINEAIKQMGFDAHYIPNTNDQARDLLFGDDPLKKFTNAFPVAVYLTNSVDPGVSNDFFSKFGLEIKNSVRVQLPRREFAKWVPQDSYTRPREGDLLYIPFLSGKGELYEIKFVNDTADFFMLGRRYPYFWELDLELFKYSSEEINTGIEEIDIVEDRDAFAIDYILSANGTGNYVATEIVYQGTDLSNANCYGTVVSWNLPNTTLKLVDISGEFSNSQIIIGATSNARYNLTSYDPLNNTQSENGWDNKTVETTSQPFIDTSEENPFGSLF